MAARLLLLPAFLAAGLLSACDGDPMDPDAGPPPDTGPPVPVSIDHCDFTEVPPTALAGGTVVEATLSAGVAESQLDVPLGATLGAYTARSEGLGRGGFLPEPDARRTQLGDSFAPSVGIETIPRVRALALRSGDETVLLMKVDLGAAYQGFLHDLEAELGADFSGKVIIATSHSHSSFGNYTGHTGLSVGFGMFRQTVYDAILSQLAATARAALANLAPAQIGFAYDAEFDAEDRVNRDRRSENDELNGGSEDDHHLFVIRVDALDDTPLAVIPVFGMHGTLHGEDNVLISTDAPGGVERVLEESFDSNVLVMHLQGAGGDVSPAGSRVVDCAGRDMCSDYGRPETVGRYALEEIRAAWESAGEDMQTEIALEMLTRTVPLGPNWETFSVRDGALVYSPWDGDTDADGVVYDESGAVISPIDEFNAPFGGPLCGDDLPLRLTRANLPGTEELEGTPYFWCKRLENIVRVMELSVGVEIGEVPVCDTTQTTLSALRLGDWMLGTLPGEPTTMLSDHLRTLSPMPAEQTIVVGYAQDHGGYLLRTEDWLLGGYEPFITFWGPLEGEYVMEQSALLMAAAATPEREDGNAAGIARVVTPTVDDGITLDTSAEPVGSVPTTLPEYILARLLRPQASAQPAATVERIQSVYFTFVGDDPLRGTPRVFLQQEVEGVFEDVVRSSGRPVNDGDLLLTWTPNPIFREAGTPRTHYYTVEFQAVTPMGLPGLEALEDRTGLPVGRYRFRVASPTYDLTSEPFEVTPATLVASSAAAGADLSVTLGVENAEGYRVLDLAGPSTSMVPLRGETITVVVDAAEPIDIAADSAGTLTVPGAASATSITLTDRFGNRATVTP